MTYELLTDDELRLVEALRDIAPGAARDELLLLIDDLVAFVADPRCARAQGDGVPCLSAGIACEECRRVSKTLSVLHGSVLRAISVSP
jgi:hypothetical protein